MLCLFSTISFHDFKVILSFDRVMWILILKCCTHIAWKAWVSRYARESFIMMRTELAFTPEKSDCDEATVLSYRFYAKSSLTFHGHER